MGSVVQSIEYLYFEATIYKYFFSAGSIFLKFYSGQLSGYLHQGKKREALHLIVYICDEVHAFGL